MSSLIIRPQCLASVWLVLRVLSVKGVSLCTGDRLDGYQKKKYVCKLVFMFLLGNDIDFGYQEAVNLLSSSHFSEKQIVSPWGLGGGEGGDQ